MYIELMTLAFKNNLEFLEHSTLWKNWLEILPSPALTLLQQLAIQNGISSNEQCICSWLLASTLKIKGEERVSFYLLHVLLEGLVIDIAQDPVADYVEEAFCHSVADFAVFILKQLESLHKEFNFDKTEMADELFYMLKCLTFADVGTFSNYVDSFPIVARESYSWYLHIINDKRIDLEEDDQNVIRVMNCLAEIIKIFLKNQILLDDIFTRAWSVKYCEITYNVLDQVVADIIKPIVQHVVHVMNISDRERDIEESLKLLQLYHNVRNLVNYVTQDLTSSGSELCMEGHSTWFGEDLVLEWFLLCNIYTHPFIEKAVKMDNMVHLADGIPHGTSVPDVASVIDEIVIDVWMKLRWEDQFYTHGALTEAIKSCVLNYVQEISNKIEDECFFTEKNQFEVKETLCVALSNVYAMFDHLQITKEKVLNVLDKTEAEYGFHVMDPLSNIENKMQIEVSETFHKVLKRISGRFSYYTKRMVANRNKLFQSSVITDTCCYIESALETMYLNFNPELFYLVLRHMWLIVVVNLNKAVTFCESSYIWRSSKSQFMIVLQALGQLQSIFYCDGHGLSYLEMRNKIYIDLNKKIEKKLKPAP